jgi:20S proteasome subunit beta 6
MRADTDALHEHMLMQRKTYKADTDRDMSVVSFARSLGNTLYYKRFFPYYTFNVVGGITPEGKGTVYTYDAVGSCEERPYSSSGSGQHLVIPVLDAALKVRSEPIDFEAAKALALRALRAATERDIATGDSLELVVLRAGLEPEKVVLPLRKD